MSQCSIRFYEELNDFLPPERRKVCFNHDFQRRASIKDVIEALGVPHTEIELLLVNGDSVDFSYIVQHGDRISVYPLFESFDVQPLIRVRLRPLRTTRFVLDVHLGKLARYLRLLGFDTLYRNDYDDAELASLASAEQRILLTRDRDLLKRAMVTHGFSSAPPIRVDRSRRFSTGWTFTARSSRSSGARVAMDCWRRCPEVRFGNGCRRKPAFTSRRSGSAGSVVNCIGKAVTCRGFGDSSTACARAPPSLR